MIFIFIESHFIIKQYNKNSFLITLHFKNLHFPLLSLVLMFVSN